MPEITRKIVAPTEKKAGPGPKPQGQGKPAVQLPKPQPKKATK
jgi:hypothetical protein